MEGQYYYYYYYYYYYWRRFHNEELHSFYRSPNIVRVIKSRRLKWAGHVARMEEGISAFKMLTGRPTGPLRPNEFGSIAQQVRRREGNHRACFIKFFYPLCPLFRWERKATRIQRGLPSVTAWQKTAQFQGRNKHFNNRLAVSMMLHS